MAAELKHCLNPQTLLSLSQQLHGVYPQFDQSRFLHLAQTGLEPLALMARGAHIAHALQACLPKEYPEAIEVLQASLGPALTATENNGLAPFFYLPHSFFISQFGLQHPEVSLSASQALTQRFTAEFCLRPFLQQHCRYTLQQLALWVHHPSEHVRRCASEATRPRLPWAMRLPAFQQDPSPLLPLLEALKDDPSRYVQRSVANHLNDIGKDHPQLLFRLAENWQTGASPQREWVIKHALRYAIKAGHPQALALQGCGQAPCVQLDGFQLSTPRPCIGQRLTLGFQLHSTALHSQTLMVDLSIGFMKANGQTREKVFKLKRLTLPAQGQHGFSKTLPLHPMTTRPLYPGRHQVSVLVNGQRWVLGHFELLAVE